MKHQFEDSKGKQIAEFEVEKQFEYIDKLHQAGKHELANLVENLTKTKIYVVPTAN